MMAQLHTLLLLSRNRVPYRRCQGQMSSALYNVRRAICDISWPRLIVFQFFSNTIQVTVQGSHVVTEKFHYWLAWLSLSLWRRSILTRLAPIPAQTPYLLAKHSRTVRARISARCRPKCLCGSLHASETATGCTWHSRQWGRKL